MSVRSNEARDRCCQLGEGPQEDVGEDQGVRRLGAEPRSTDASRVNDLDHVSDAVDACIVASDGGRAGVDVARQHGTPQRFRRGDGKHAGACADVEHAGFSSAPAAERGRVRRLALAPSSLRERVKRQQAAARGAVMAGAEGERRLDLNADLVRPHAGATVRPVHDEPTGLDRREAFEAFAHPVRGRERLEPQRIGCRRAGGGRDQRPHGRFVGSIAEIQREDPAAVGLLEGGSRDLFRIEALGQHIADVPCRRPIGRQARDHGGSGQRRGRRHSDVSAHPRNSPPLIPRLRPATHRAIPKLCSIYRRAVHSLAALLSTRYPHACPPPGPLFAQGCPQLSGLAARPPKR